MSHKDQSNLSNNQDFTLATYMILIEMLKYIASKSLQAWNILIKQ